MNQKWTNIKIEEYVRDNADGYFVTNIIKGNKGGKTRVFITCNNGHEYDVNFDNFQKGKRCLVCSGKMKLTYAQVKTFIENDSESNCTLLSTTYSSIDDKLNIICPCENDFETTFYNFKHNKKRTCNKCRYDNLSLKFRSDIEYIREKIYILSAGNCKLLSEEYINSKTPIKLSCGCGNNFELKYCDFLTNKQYQCRECGFRKRADSRTLSYEYVKSYFESNNYKLISLEYVGVEIPLEVRCPEGHLSNIIFNNFSRGSRCQQCYFNSMGGESSHNWQGGISSLAETLRHSIVEWKKESMKNSNYKCVVTDDKFDAIHHLHSFNKILDEVLSDTGIPLLSNIGEYTDLELELLKTKCIELHDKYGLGVCLRSDIHFLFHGLYGKKNNTKNQFEEFKERYIAGEFKEVS